MALIDYWPVAVVGATTALSYGDLRARVSANRDAIDGKASREVVEVQYREIISRLDRIEDRVNHRHEGV